MLRDFLFNINALDNVIGQLKLDLNGGNYQQQMLHLSIPKHNIFIF
jgi:hypothetical protein